MDWGEAVGDQLGVEFHDSDMACMEYEGSTLVIRLSPAYLHRSSGKPGWDQGTLWKQDVELRFDEAQFNGDTPPLPGDIYNGSVKLGDKIFNNLISTTIEFAGDVEMTLEFRSGEILRVSGKGVRLDLAGKAEFVDVWPAN